VGVAAVSGVASPKGPLLRPPTAPREQRFTDEVVVDAYTSEERAMSWYYYLEEKLVFPFKARCVAVRSLSPLKNGEQVEVTEMAKEDDCMREMFMLIRFAERKLGVPLSQLEVSEVKSETREAVDDWRYWVAMGYEF
jgi:hypothetical protein